MPQPQISAPADGEAHQSLGPELMESATAEDEHSARASMSTPILSAPAPDVATMSTRLVEEEEVASVNRPGT